jgi:DNA polymerase-3 subunit gamma/tau
MAYTVLARKYRSQTFDDVVGQDHVAQTLKRAIESDRIAHAFLFCGTRGTGKTSMARILAKSLNCLSSKGPTTKPCLKCDSCERIARGDDMDVIEIDAASNTQVDKTREVILDNTAYRPARGRFKIYIIDEVHMLSKASFNALLKTLEEPPEHVKFILATTEAEKVLQTILSRCQRYDFRNISTREIAAHLKEICKQEKISAEEDALMLVAKAGAGSMRDSLSLLDRLLSVGEKKLTTEMIEQMLGLPKAQLMFDLADGIGGGDVKKTLAQAADMITRGMSADTLVAALVDHLRNLLILRTCGPDSELVEVPGLSIKDLTAQAEKFDPVNLTQDITILEELRRHMRQSQSGRALLDATLVRLTLAEQFTPVSELLARVGGASAGDGSQKKKVDSGTCVSGTGILPVNEVVRELRSPPPVRKEPSPQPSPTRDSAVRVEESNSARVGEGAGNVPVVAAPPDLSFDDDDDDLPAPGKVWDNSGPSLKELLAQEEAKIENTGEPPVPPHTPVPTQATQEPDVTAAWQALLDSVKEMGAGLHGVLVNAKFEGIRDEQAVIRFSKSFATFTKMLEKNGKKDLVRSNLSKALGRNVGVRFEVEEEAVATAQAEQPRPAPVRREVPKPAPVVPEAPAAPVIKITPELLEQMRGDPLVLAVMETLNATPVKIE